MICCCKWIRDLALSPTNKQPTLGISPNYTIPISCVELRLWALKTFSIKLAASVAAICNASIRQAQVPSYRKGADIIPIHKNSQVPGINSYLRLILLTGSLSKILEYLNFKLDLKQFESLKGSSSVDALINILHRWYADINGKLNESFCLILARRLIGQTIRFSWQKCVNVGLINPSWIGGSTSLLKEDREWGFAGFDLNLLFHWPARPVISAHQWSTEDFTDPKLLEGDL